VCVYACVRESACMCVCYRERDRKSLRVVVFECERE
jgi:hypothetical protein